MAVAPTGAIYKALEFDGVSSRTYGVYITGEAVYNAPERDVEMITIPGRNGSFALDNGRFQNIEVSYPAGIFAETEADFRQAISDFRNFLCSRNGYVRLQDEYNPDEYRMAVYKSGLEVDPAMLKAGEFTITFDCKPQRWLTSGETAIQIPYDSGYIITNPTLFDAYPLFETTGYGTIEFNGHRIEISNAELGTVNLTASERTFYVRLDVPYDLAALNDGDSITVPLKLVTVIKGTVAPQSPSVSDSNNTFSSSYNLTQPDSNNYAITVTTTANIVYTKSASDYSVSDAITVSLGGGVPFFTYRYDIVAGANGGITINTRYTARPDPDVYHWDWDIQSSASKVGIITGYSTVPSTGKKYIDCDLGEAYLVKDGVPISINAYVDFGSQLPTLAPGDNVFTCSATLNYVKVTPRWWKI